MVVIIKAPHIVFRKRNNRLVPYLQTSQKSYVAWMLVKTKTGASVPAFRLAESRASGRKIAGSRFVFQSGNVLLSPSKRPFRPAYFPLEPAVYSLGWPP